MHTHRGTNRRFLLSMIAVALVALVSLSACISNTGNTSNTGSTAGTLPAGPIKIGVSVSLTGDNSADGQATQQGYDTWAAFVNNQGGILGHQVKMVYYDDGTKQEQIKSNYEKLISVDHVNFVLGPFGDSQTVTGAVVARQHHMAFVEGIGTAPEVYKAGLDNLFSVSLSATAYLGSFVNYILSLPAAMRPTSVAYATSDDPFTEPQITTARAALEHGGLHTAVSEVYSAENADPTGFAQKVVAANADIVILGTTGLQDCMVYMKTFKQQHYNPKLIVATAGPDQGSAFVNAIGTKNTEGLLVPNAGWWPESKSYQNTEFVNFITAKYHIAPGDISSDSVQAFSAGQVLEQAIIQTKSFDNQKVMQALRAGSFNSLQGPVKFASDGHNTLEAAYLFQWQHGTLIPVFPNEQAQANLEYPKPAWTASS